MQAKVFCCLNEIKSIIVISLFYSSKQLSSDKFWKWFQAEPEYPKAELYYDARELCSGHAFAC